MSHKTSNASVHPLGDNLLPRLFSHYKDPHPNPGRQPIRTFFPHVRYPGLVVILGIFPLLHTAKIVDIDLQASALVTTSRTFCAIFRVLLPL
jgi:hypothetical protein